MYRSCERGCHAYLACSHAGFRCAGRGHQGEAAGSVFIRPGHAILRPSRLRKEDVSGTCLLVAIVPRRAFNSYLVNRLAASEKYSRALPSQLTETPLGTRQIRMSSTQQGMATLSATHLATLHRSNAVYFAVYEIVKRAFIPAGGTARVQPLFL